ncbi:hypothetical protein HMPREF1149_1224 [Streptococcus sp. BS35b]|nr:hypothetical protein HMPREF1149_1224 [Streptococcus sp. BS35b]ETS89332.1 hypothetical protein HMPREF1513_1351 [Streptococcus sp. BS29a]EUB29862.1 hypothetical protein HMPREF1515_0707 [Streptococcus sp. BS21]
MSFSLLKKLGFTVLKNESKSPKTVILFLTIKNLDLLNKKR